MSEIDSAAAAAIGIKLWRLSNEINEPIKRFEAATLKCQEKNTLTLPPSFFVCGAVFFRFDFSVNLNMRISSPHKRILQYFPTDCIFIFSAILSIYIKNKLHFSEDSATVIYHTFSLFCYFTPIFGAMLADQLLGKFK